MTILNEREWWEFYGTEIVVPTTTLKLTNSTLTEESSPEGTIVSVYTLTPQGTGITVDFTSGTNTEGYYILSGTEVLLTSTGVTYLDLGTVMPDVSLTTSDGVTRTNYVTTVLIDDETTITVTNGTVTQGTTVAGNVVSTFTASDEDSVLTFDFTEGTNTNGYYAISGFNILLTSAGETFLNARNTMPNVSITTNTGVTSSNTITTVLVANTRYTPNLDGVTNYYQMSAGKTLTGDFIFSGYYYMNGSSYFAASKNNSTGRFLYFKDNNSLYVSGAAQTAITVVPSTTFSVDTVYFVEVQRVNNVVTWKVDGVQVGTAQSHSGAVYIDSLASKWGGSTSIPNQKGRMRDITIGATGNTEFFSLNNPFSDYPSNIYGSKGTRLTGYNFTSSQIEVVNI